MRQGLVRRSLLDKLWVMRTAGCCVCIRMIEHDRATDVNIRKLRGLGTRGSHPVDTVLSFYLAHQVGEPRGVCGCRAVETGQEAGVEGMHACKAPSIDEELMQHRKCMGWV